MNAIGGSILAALIVVVFFAPRRWALLGMMAGVLYLPQAQHIDVGGLNIFAMRILEIVGFSRVMVRREFSFAGLNSIDKALLLFYSYMTMIFLLRSTEGQAYQVGLLVDALLSYFTFRGLIEGVEELLWFLSSFLILLVPFMLILFIERETSNNLFSIIGGSSNAEYVRNGIPRCFGSFRHPVLLGTLGASFLPLYIGLVFSKVANKRALLGVSLCLGIVYVSNSGGPVSAALIGMIGWLFWGFRTKMHLVRRGLVIFVLLIALFMKAPIWYLPMKLSSITGGDGWHRSYLIDVTIKNIDQWWLAGMSIKDTAGWLPYMLGATGGADITNQYIVFGLTAGLMAIVLFVFLLIQTFRSLGEAIIVTRSKVSTPKLTEILLWGLGVMLTVHIFNWIGVSYFDQIYVVWFMQLAAISKLSQIVTKKSIPYSMKEVEDRVNTNLAF